MYIDGPSVNKWVVDIESDDLKATKVWLAVFENTLTDQQEVFTDYKDIRDFTSSVLAKGGSFVGHNKIRFDAPTLNRLCGTRIPISRIVDTFVLSMLFNPNLDGGHSLEAWGKRMGMPKGDFNDFSRYSEEMLTYCKQDVKITKELYRKLSQRMRQIGFTEKGPEIEHKAWYIIGKQQKNGFHFDADTAEKLLSTIRARETELQKQIYELFPPVRSLVRTFSKATKADGNPTANYIRHLSEYPELKLNEDGSYSAFADIEFNLGSPKQRVEKLLELGWVPDQFTKAGSPKVDEDSLLTFADKSGKPEIAALAKWIALNGRGNAINNWLGLYNNDTGCIHGNLWLASTLRYRHDKPNTANIPAVRCDKDGHPILGEEGAYTYESRDLWGSRDRRNRNLVGVDAKGIQLRVLSHYVNDPAFTKAVLAGDPHTHNANLLGLPRPTTKTFTYALIMGGGDGKLGEVAGGSAKLGKELRAKLEGNLGDFKRLINRLKDQLEERGRIQLCDSSWVNVSSPHMVIPYLLQGDESRLMKQAAIFLDEKVRKNGLDALKVGDIHDEWQTDVARSDTNEYIRLAMESFIEAGEEFNYRLPIEGDSKVGLTWAETH